MSVTINYSGTSEYFEVKPKVCFQLEAKLNASRYVDRWSDLGDKLYQAGSGNLDLISIPEHQYFFLKTALTTPHPRPEDIKPLRKVAFDGGDSPSRPEPKFTWMKSDTSKRDIPKRDIPRYDLGTRKPIGFMVPVGGGMVFMPLK
jgi:hypothetical protein